MEKRIDLTQKQSELVDKLNELLRKMNDEGIHIVYDRKEYSWAAINAKNILHLQDAYEHDKDAVNIEDQVHWGNIDIENIHDYDSYYGDLYAVFGN